MPEARSDPYRLYMYSYYTELYNLWYDRSGVLIIVIILCSKLPMFRCMTFIWNFPAHPISKVITRLATNNYMYQTILM